MDQDHFPPPDFALPGFAALVELTMAAQQLDHDQAIVFLEQHRMLHTLRLPMVFFFLFLFAPLFAAFLLTVYVALCKPGCAISAADMSSV